MWTRTPRDATARRQTEAANYKPERGSRLVEQRLENTVPSRPVGSVSSGKQLDRELEVERNLVGKSVKKA